MRACVVGGGEGVDGGEGGGHVYVQQAAAFALSYNPLLAVLLLRPLALY